MLTDVQTINDEKNHMISKNKKIKRLLFKFKKIPLKNNHENFCLATSTVHYKLLLQVI